VIESKDKIEFSGVKTEAGQKKSRFCDSLNKFMVCARLGLGVECVLELQLHTLPNLFVRTGEPIFGVNFVHGQIGYYIARIRQLTS
jgi:hypothetical protein